MSGFAPDPSSLPIVYPPVDIPAPEQPPPNFSTIGAAFAAENSAAKKALEEQPGAFDWLWKQLLRAVAAVISVFANLATLVLQQIFQVFQSSEPELNALVTSVVAGMFGSGVHVDPFADVTQSENRRGTSDSIMAVFVNALKAGVGPSGNIVPSHKGADTFMQVCSHMAVEGWFLGWLGELTAAGQLETFAELKDIIEASLGLGRMARRCMAAPLKILIEDPYTWELNQTYHPTLLNPGEAIRAYLRGKFDLPTLQGIMNLHGYTSDKVDELIYDQIKPLQTPEILELLIHGQFSVDDAQAAMQKQGYDQTNALYALQVAQKNRTEAWERKGCDEALSIYKSKKIDRPTYDNVIQRANLPADEKSFYTQIANIFDYSKQSLLSMAEGTDLYKYSLWDITQFEALATQHGYSSEDIASLDSLVRFEKQQYQDAQQAKIDANNRRIARENAAAAKAAAALLKAQMQVEEKGVSTGEYEYLVEQGLRTYAQYRAYLIMKEVAPDNADALTTALQIKLKAKADAAAAKAAALAAKQIKHASIAQLETAVKQGTMTTVEFGAMLVARGFTPADAALIAADVQGQVDTTAAKAKATAAAKAAAAIKHVDLSQEERAVRLGNQTIDQYAAMLESKGFEQESIDTLVANLNDQLATDKQTAAKKAAAAAKLTNKGISIAQLERLVRAGTEPIASYTAALATAGYDAADQAALTQYLQLQMDQDQQDLILHGHAAALVDQLGVSMADLERAVKLSVVPIATYQDALQRAGVAPADQTTLVNTLAAQIKTTRAAQTTLQSVSKTVAAAGVSLASIEKDTVSGKISIQQFQALLAGYGVSTADVSDVVALVQDEIDNAAAVKALVAGATAKAAAKGLNLSQITAAYKQNVLDETTWRADVAGLGYDAADVEILFETLAATQAAAAAKSAAKTTPPATTTATAGA